MRHAAIALLAAGCVGSVAHPPPDAAAVADLAPAPSPDLAAAPGDLASAYPAGPYGNSVGEVFPLLPWEGYLDENTDAVATTKPYGPWGSDALRKSGRRYALIHISDFI